MRYISEAEAAARRKAFEDGRKVGALDVQRQVTQRVVDAVARGDVREAAVVSVLTGRPATVTRPTPKLVRAAAPVAKAPPPKAPAKRTARAATKRPPDGRPPGSVGIQIYGPGGGMGYWTPES